MVAQVVSEARAAARRTNHAQDHGFQTLTATYNMKYISLHGPLPAPPRQIGLLIYLERKQTHNFHEKRDLTLGRYSDIFYFTL